MGENIGRCVRGSHLLVRGDTAKSDSLYTVHHTSMMSADSLMIPTCTALATKVSTDEVANFFKGEQLGNSVEPKCLACCCYRCPLLGSIYPFREEAKLKLIEE